MLKEKFLGAFELLIILGILWFGYSCWEAFHNRRQIHPRVTANLIEAEQLQPTFESKTMQILTQGTEQFNAGAWSGDKHLFFAHGQVGDKIYFRLSPPAQKGKVLHARLTTARDYGIAEIFVNGRHVGEVDLYNRFISNAEVTLGAVDEVENPIKVEFRIKGHHPDAHAPHHHFGIDGFWYEDQKSHQKVVEN